MKRIIHLFAVALLSSSLYGCEKQGPAERAGENIDDAIEELKDAGKELTE